ncbi:MAG: helix-turn-helix domain-containing protein [Burkholderiaceae bacterium]|nr:helix-turn-helix domain-containing protein [Burkholderiaceae bacterium]
MDMQRGKPVRAIERAFDVLLAVAELKPASLLEIQERSGLPRPTVARILKTLTEVGAIRRGMKDEKYHLAHVIADLARRLDPKDLLAEIAAPYLDELSSAIHWPAVVSVYEPDPGEYMLVLESSVKRSRFYVRPSATKAHINVLLSSLGVAYLAFLDEPRRAVVTARLRQSRDSHNLVGIAAGELEQRLEQVRRQGYAGRHPLYRGGSYNEPPADDGLSGLAVPLLHDDCAFGSLNVYWNRKAMKVEEAAVRHLERIREAANRVSAEAGRCLVAQSLLQGQWPADHRG